jgi:hypothetical protein
MPIIISLRVDQGLVIGQDLKYASSALGESRFALASRHPVICQFTARKSRRELLRMPKKKKLTAAERAAELLAKRGAIEVWNETKLYRLKPQKG